MPAFPDAEKLTRLVHQFEIRDVLQRYARGVDRRCWELMEAAFFPDAVDHHGDFSGSPAEFVKWLGERHAVVPKSTHMLGNCLIEFASEDVAIVETYFNAKLELGPDAVGHRRLLLGENAPAADETLYSEVIGRYLDRFERRAGEWRIAERHVAFDSVENRPVRSPGGGAVGLQGRRDCNDAIFGLRSKAGLK